MLAASLRPFKKPALRAFLTCACVAPVAAQGGSLTLANRNPDGSIISHHTATERRALSSDGRYFVFATNNDGVLPEDQNGFQDVYLRDRWTGQLELISVGVGGAPADSYSLWTSISADGRYVAFSSRASNLVANDTNNELDVFLRDRQLGTTELISVSTQGVQSNHQSQSPSVSADGQRVAFTSFANNLVAGDTEGHVDVFVRDRAAGTTFRVSVHDNGTAANWNSHDAMLSEDGGSVLFHTSAGNLSPDDHNNEVDAFVHTIATGLTEIVGFAQNGLLGNHPTAHSSFSADGRYVAFATRSMLVPGDTNGTYDIFVRDMRLGLTTRVSADSSGVLGNGESLSPEISPDGGYVAFSSRSTNLGGSTTTSRDVYLHDRTSGETTWVGQTATGEQPGGAVIPRQLGLDAQFIAMIAFTGNMLPGPSPFGSTYVREIDGCVPSLVSYCVSSSTSIPGCSAALTANGAPSLTQPTGFTISTSEVPGGALFGVGYFSLNGASANPLGTQGGLVCVAAPLVRTPPIASGGTAGVCNGSYQVTLADLLAAYGSGIEPGHLVHYATWFRDPGSSDGFGLSHGIWFPVCP